jgi:hypothetical protein
MTRVRGAFDGEHMGGPEPIWPYTLEDLIAADMLLGTPEHEAREFWTAYLAHAEREWQDYLAHQDEPGRAFGFVLAAEVLLALSLVSEEAAARVERLREDGWQARLAAARTGLISTEELEGLREEKRIEEEEWARKREALRRSIAERRRRDEMGGG